MLRSCVQGFQEKWGDLDDSCISMSRCKRSSDEEESIAEAETVLGEASGRVTGGVSFQIDRREEHLQGFWPDGLRVHPY